MTEKFRNRKSKTTLLNTNARKLRLRSSECGKRVNLQMRKSERYRGLERCRRKLRIDRRRWMRSRLKKHMKNPKSCVARRKLRTEGN